MFTIATLLNKRYIVTAMHCVKMIHILATLLNKRYIVTAMHCIKSGTEVAKSVEVKVVPHK